MSTFKCKSHGSTSRVGLYLMVFFLLVHSCNARDDLQEIGKRLDEVQEQAIRIESRIIWQNEPKQEEAFPK